MSETTPRPTLWLDVSALVGLAHVTGIPRVIQQLALHWKSQSGYDVRPCRYDPAGRTYVAHGPAAQEACRPAPVAPMAPVPSRPRLMQRVKRRLGQVARRLPGRVQTALHHYYLGTRALAGEGRAALTQVLQVAPKPPFQPGDALFLPGTDWGDDRTMAVLPQLRAEYGLRVASIIYDISPLRCPHLLAPYLKDVFAAWLPSALANSDVILTISNYSRDDLRTYCATRGLFCPPVEVIRLGDEPLMDQEAQRPTTLPQDDRPFAMMVSTLSLHKNQWLLVEVWRRLIRRYGSRVPRLLLVGGAGWRHEALIEEVAGDPGLRDHVVHLHGIPDAQLRWLYRQCRFTLYPSWYEGWGLPVAESLVNGKPCIASSATSLPEVGGDLVDYHDPYDASSLVTLVEQASFDPVWLRERQDRIRRDYRQTSWSSCANQTIGILEKYLGLVPQTIPKAA